MKWLLYPYGRARCRCLIFSHVFFQTTVFFRGIFIISPSFSHRVHIIYYRSVYVYMYVWDAVSDVCFDTTCSYTPYAHYRWLEARKHKIFPANLSSLNAKTSGQKTFPVDDIHIYKVYGTIIYLYNIHYGFAGCCQRSTVKAVPRSCIERTRHSGSNVMIINK